MSVRRHAQGVLPGLLLGICGVVLAADNELPDGEFLEYLGSWEESDEEWLIFDQVGERVAADGERVAADGERVAADGERVAADSDEKVDPAPQGEGSAEKDDES